MILASMRETLLFWLQFFGTEYFSLNSVAVKSVSPAACNPRFLQCAYICPVVGDLYLWFRASDAAWRQGLKGSNRNTTRAAHRYAKNHQADFAHNFSPNTAVSLSQSLCAEYDFATLMQCIAGTSKHYQDDEKKLDKGSDAYYEMQFNKARDQALCDACFLKQ